MNQNSQILLEKLVTDTPLSVSELKELKILFSEKRQKSEIDDWILHNWESAAYSDLEINFDNLKQLVITYKTRKEVSPHSSKQIVAIIQYYRRIAAILFLPLFLAATVYLIFGSPWKENLYTAEAPLGQKAKIELPDGSSVWLNSGSKIKYSSDFNKKNREIDLSGEAYFEVQKNTGKPFIVHTPILDVKVTGTKFNVNAYSEEPSIETSLVEGKVEINVANENKTYHLTPGHVMACSKLTKEMTSHILNKEAAIGWKDNRLIFVNDNFYKLVNKIEKWYDVKVVYDTLVFRNNKLTVKLLEGEHLEKLLRIIESTIGAKCSIDNDTIYITRR